MHTQKMKDERERERYRMNETKNRIAATTVIDEVLHIIQVFAFYFIVLIVLLLPLLF